MNWDLVTAVVVTICLHGAVFHFGHSISTDAKQQGQSLQALVVELQPAVVTAPVMQEIAEPTVEEVVEAAVEETVEPVVEEAGDIDVDDVVAGLSEAAVVGQEEEVSPVEEVVKQEIASVEEKAEPAREWPVEVEVEQAAEEVKEVLPVQTAQVKPSGDHDAVATYSPDPKYPQAARRRGYEGVVVLDIEVLVSGRPGKVTVRESSGYRILDRAAMAAVKGWRFNPATRGGQAVRQVVSKPIEFRIIK